MPILSKIMLYINKYIKFAHRASLALTFNQPDAVIDLFYHYVSLTAKIVVTTLETYLCH